MLLEAKQVKKTKAQNVVDDIMQSFSSHITQCILTSIKFNASSLDLNFLNLAPLYPSTCDLHSSLKNKLPET